MPLGMQLVSFIFFVGAIGMGAKVPTDGKWSWLAQSQNKLWFTAGLTLFAAFWQMVAFSLVASVHNEQHDFFDSQDLKGIDKDPPTSTLGYCFGLSVFSFLVTLITGPVYFYLGMREGPLEGNDIPPGGQQNYMQPQNYVSQQQQQQQDMNTGTHGGYTAMQN